MLTRRACEVLVVVVFVAGIGLPLLGGLLGWDTGLRPGENRSLAPAPELRLERGSIKAFPKQFERYFNDRFGFRNSLVALNSIVKVAGFGTSTSADVILGENGFLYYASDFIIDDWRGLHPFSGDELQRWQVVLEERHDWLAAQGIQFVFAIAPEKSSIYPEHLPRHITRIHPASRTDQLIAHMKAHSHVVITDLRINVAKAKQAGLTHFKTDSHWNSRGAYAGYEALARAIGEEPIPREKLKMRTGKGRFSGDLAGMLGRKDHLSEESPPALLLAESTSTRGELTELIERKALLYRWADERTPWITTAKGAKQRRAVVVHDSYMIGMAPFLSEHFGRTVYLSRTFEPEIIKDERPDVVINEVIERVFSQSIPVNLQPVGK
jgi:alginate O-acetyltransferase complex protein AlgJ